MPKAVVKSAAHATLLRSTTMEPPRHVWLWMADAIGQPFVETYMLCCPVGLEVDERGVHIGELPAAPYSLEFLAGASRLSQHGQGGFGLCAM